MSTKSQTEIREDVDKNLASYLPTFGAPADSHGSDLIDAVVKQIADGNTELAVVQKTASVDYPLDVEDDDVDALATTWNLTRRGGVPATVTVTFSRRTAPTSNIVIGNSTGGGGVVIAAPTLSSGVQVSFVTTETVTMPISVTKDTATNLYSITCPAECLQIGTIGNVPAGTITQIQSSAPGMDLVVNNTASGGGKEEESNEELTTRIRLKAQGLHPGIDGGLRSKALTVLGVIDAIAVGPSDASAVRDLNGGSVDVYVLGEHLVAKQQSFVYTTSQNQVTIDQRPATDVIGLVGLVGSSQYSFVRGVDYQFQQDSGTLAGSASSLDMIVWLGNTVPDAGSIATLTYISDSLIADVQAEFDDETSTFISANVLAKRSTKVIVDVSMQVVKLSGFVASAVKNSVSTALTTYVNALGLGVNLQQSDLVAAVAAVEGVDRVVLPLSTLARRGSTGASDVVASDLEYLRVDDTSVVITVS